jgi:flagellar motor protein MotB
MLVFLIPMLVMSDISPEQAAQMKADEAKNLEAVSKKFGGRKSSELSADERREMIRAQADAERKALEKNGLSAKEWSRHSQTLSRQGAAETKAASETLKAKEDAAQKAAEEAARAKEKAANAIEVVGQEAKAEDESSTDINVLEPANSSSSATTRTRSSGKRRK